MTFTKDTLKDPKIIFSFLISLGLIIITIFSTWLFCDLQETRRLDAESVALVPDLTVNFGAVAKVSDFLAKLDGQLVKDSAINTETLGDQTVTFEYINIKSRRRTASFTIQVRDQTPPRIIGSSSYTVTKGYAGNLTNLMLSGDDCDDSPRREILGNYDLGRVGTYELEYSITDASGNQTKKPFTLRVVNPSPSSSQPTTGNNANKLKIADVIKRHKTDQTKIGIDVSQWQGKIDWSTVKSAGIEFAFIRIGYQAGYDGEYVLDPYFVDNITAANSLNLPVGVYFYSYANTIDQAKAQAAWITEQLQGHTAALGVAFDWEDWGNFNVANMSFHTINQVASTFLDGISNSGYRSLLYGSKYYLEAIWDLPQYSTWLAQYYDRVTYPSSYQIWQMSNTGKVPGINGDVDIDIMYLQPQN